MYFPPDRPKEEVKQEFSDLRKKLLAKPEGERGWRERERLRYLADEYHLKTLETFENEEKACRLYTIRGVYCIGVVLFVDGRPSISGTPLFGGTEDRDTAYEVWQKEIDAPNI